MSALRIWLVVLIGWLDRQEREALAYLNGRSRTTVPAVPATFADQLSHLGVGEGHAVGIASFLHGHSPLSREFP